jgi:hypothetical protein
LVELRGIELEGQELSGLEEEAIPLPPSRRVLAPSVRAKTSRESASDAPR